VQPTIIPWSKKVTEAGIVSEVMPEQFIKAEVSIAVIVLGRVMEVMLGFGVEELAKAKVETLTTV
jgi:hypothetical protein